MAGATAGTALVFDLAIHDERQMPRASLQLRWPESIMHAAWKEQQKKCRRKKKGGEREGKARERSEPSALAAEQCPGPPENAPMRATREARETSGFTRDGRCVGEPPERAAEPMQNNDEQKGSQRPVSGAAPFLGAKVQLQPWPPRVMRRTTRARRPLLSPE